MLTSILMACEMLFKKYHKQPRDKINFMLKCFFHPHFVEIAKKIKSYDILNT